MYGRSKTDRNGFSLVELSIVLVILGLLTGGILAGQSLIRAAELRGIISDYQRYTAAKNTFRDKYMAMPGDMNNATRFWGRLVNQPHCVSNSGAAVNTSTGVCDGNGNGIMEDAASANESGEAVQHWRHLAQAGLIEGTFTGLADSGQGIDYTIGTNVPASRISSVGWGANSINNLVVNTSNTFFKDFRGSLTIGTDDGWYMDGAFLKAEEAWNIDTKLDDGRPAQGRLNVWPVGAPCNDAANQYDLDADYILTSQDRGCALIFPPS